MDNVEIKILDLEQVKLLIAELQERAEKAEIRVGELAGRLSNQAYATRMAEATLERVRVAYGRWSRNASPSGEFEAEMRAALGSDPAQKGMNETEPSLVRPVDRSVLGSEEPNPVHLPGADVANNGPFQAHNDLTICDWCGKKALYYGLRHYECNVASMREQLVPHLHGETGYPVSVSGVRTCLAKIGLHIVSAAEKAVLDAPAPAAEPTGWEYRARHFEARVAELEATLEGVRAYERCEAWDADGCQMSLGEILAGHTPAPAQAAVSSLEEYADLTGSPMADSKATAQACQVPTEGWVFFDNLEEQAIDDHIQLNAALRRAEELSSALQSELKKSRDRLVEHKQMNRSLNEVVQATQARVDKALNLIDRGRFWRAAEVLRGE